MAVLNEDVLRSKGWTSAEIEKTKRIMQRGEDEDKASLFNQILYWGGLVIAIIGTMILSVVLVPFLLIMPGMWLVLTLALLGVSFGGLFKVIISSLENISRQKYVIAGLFIPSFVLVNVYVMTYLSNNLITLLNLSTPLHSPIIVSLFYVGAFTLPYAFFRWREQI